MSRKTTGHTAELTGFVVETPFAVLFEGCIDTLLDKGEPCERKVNAQSQLMQVAQALDDLGLDFAVESDESGHPILHVAMN
jgi:hypothetical protein